MEKFSIELTNANARLFKYYLGKRYGRRKHLKNMLKIAATEIVASEARKEAKEAERKLTSEEGSVTK